MLPERRAAIEYPARSALRLFGSVRTERTPVSERRSAYQPQRSIPEPGASPADFLRLLPLASSVGLLAPVYGAAVLLGRRHRNRLATEAGARDALAQLGLTTRGAIAVTPLGGGLSNALVVVTLGRETLVLKRALPVGTVLAFGAGRLGPMPYSHAVSGPSRIARELRALTRLRASGVRVPAVLAADPEAGLLALEYLEGQPLLASAGSPEWLERVAAFGRALAAAHRAGVVLTDCHPGNALVLSGGRTALLDLEFAEHRDDLGDRFAGRRAFDIAYAAGFLRGDERSVFLREALADNGLPEMAEAHARLRPFAPLFARERRRQRRIAHKGCT